MHSVILISQHKAQIVICKSELHLLNSKRNNLNKTKQSYGEYGLNQEPYNIILCALWGLAKLGGVKLSPRPWG